MTNSGPIKQEAAFCGVGEVLWQRVSCVFLWAELRAMVRDCFIPVDRAESSSKLLFSMYVMMVVGLLSLDQSALAQPQPADAAPAEPAAASPLLSEPTTPDALFDAVVLMTDLARPRLAREYLQKLLAANPDDVALLAMRDKHGPAEFLRMANLESLQPGSATLLERMTAAFTRFAGDAKRIDSLIEELRGTPSVRDAAILQLRSGGALVVPRLIETIGDVKDEQTRELLTYTLTRLGTEVIPPLLAALDSPDPNLQSIVLEVLGRVGNEKTAVHLWYFAVDKNKPPGVRVSAAEAVARLTMGNRRHASSLSQQMALRSLERAARDRLAGREIPPIAGPTGKVTS
ncbi:MAG: HEAT repeat domain-containing protein, partial [Planctomycetota bacterium]|nr:HEAT repeat domain-containing protein [Planctomycetota bacterium]